MLVRSVRVGAMCCLLLLLACAGFIFDGCAPGAGPTSPAPIVTPEDLVFEPGVTTLAFQVAEASAGTARTLYLRPQGFDGGASDWISQISPSTIQTDGLNPVTVQVTIDRTGLATGAYEGGVVVSTAAQAAGGAIRQEETGGTAAVTIWTIVGSGDDPSDPLSVAPSELAFGVDQTSMTTTITVPYTGSPWTTGKTADWISSISPDGGRAWPPPSQGAPPESLPVTITVNRSGLADGLYEGWVWFHQETFLLLKVTMTVGTPPVGESGMLVYWSDAAGNSEIYSMDSDGTGPSRLTTHTARDEWPCWSPDNAKIAWETNRPGEPNWEIYAMNADGTGAMNLTSNAAEDLYPDWAPSGGLIAFTSRRDGNREIYTMTSTGASPTRITSNTSDDRHPSWSSDGSRIAFDSDRDTGSGAPTTPPDRNRYDVYAMNANGTGVARLTTSATCDWQPCWSPVASRIAFISNRSGSYEVWVMNADGSGQTQVTTLGGEANKPSWSPDGARIAFSCEVSGNTDIYTVNANGTGLTRVTTAASSEEYPSWRAW